MKIRRHSLNGTPLESVEAEILGRRRGKILVFLDGACSLVSEADLEGSPAQIEAAVATASLLDTIEALDARARAQAETIGALREDLLTLSTLVEGSHQ